MTEQETAAITEPQRTFKIQARGRAGGPRQAAGGPNGGAVYGLGMIGALVYFWQGATTREERLLAFPMAMVWPAFLVYRAFKRLDQ
jgi:hypothetical protein